MIVRNKVATRIAHNGKVERCKRRQHISPASVFVCVNRFRIVDTFVNSASHVFKEATKDSAIDRSHVMHWVQMKFGGRHVSIVVGLIRAQLKRL